MRINLPLLLSLFLPLLLAACMLITAGHSSPGPAVGASPPTPHNVEQQSPDSPLLTDEASAEAEPMVTMAREHLARKLHIPVAQIALFTADPIIWSDATLGCPQSGVVARQTEIAGYLILLEAGGKTYTYHTDTVDRVILCEVRPPNEIYNPP